MLTTQVVDKTALGPPLVLQKTIGVAPGRPLGDAGDSTENQGLSWPLQFLSLRTQPTKNNQGSTKPN